jgi:FAD binding domain/Berberine and berberine like
MDAAALRNNAGPEAGPGPGTGAGPGGPAMAGAAVAENGAAPRRRFLAMAGLAAGTVPLSGLVRSGATAPVARRRPGRPGVAPGNSDWEALRRALSTHKLIRPGDRSYSAAKELFDPRFDFKKPVGIAYCGNARDVSTCLAFVRKFSLPVAARTGGHSYAGWSSITGGLIVDVTGINWFHTKGSSVQVGAGIRLIDLYNQLASRGLAVPGGSCATVGLAGLTLGGGVGVLSRAFGLTSDNVQSLTIVTADGQIRTASPSSNSDLYWACRGGGGGNFGIATSFTFRARHLSQLVLFFLSWPWSSAARVVAGWQSWAPFQPDALWSNLHLSAAQRGGTPVVQVGGTYLGSVAGCQALLSKLYSAVGSRPVNPGNVFLTSYGNAMLIEAGCSGLSVSECHLPSQTKNGRLARVPSYAKSDFFTKKIPAAGIRKLISGIEQMRGVRGAAGGVGAIAFDALGGAVNRVKPSATAFVHRDALFDAQYSTSWNEGGSANGAGRQHDWLRSFYSSVHPFASGQAYQNYIDPDLTNWQQAYYGSNFTQLTKVKAKYDPHQVFKFPQSIPPAS